LLDDMRLMEIDNCGKRHNSRLTITLAIITKMF